MPCQLAAAFDINRSVYYRGVEPQQCSKDTCQAAGRFVLQGGCGAEAECCERGGRLFRAGRCIACAHRRRQVWPPGHLHAGGPEGQLPPQSSFPSPAAGC